MHPDDPAPDSSGEGQQSAPPPRAVATTDPGIATRRAGDEGGDLEPDETLVAETSQVRSAVPGYVSQASPFVEPRRADPGGRQGDKGEKKKDGKADDHKNGSAPEHRPAWMGLALTAVLAMACGLGGAWAFTHFGSSKDKDQDQAKGGDQSKGGSGGSSKKGGSSTGQDQGQGGNQAAGDPHSESPKSMAGDDVDKSKEQIQQLYTRFATLQQRVDAMATPRDANPPDLVAIRVRLGELSRKVDEVASIPERARRIEDQLDRLREEVKALRDQLSAAGARGVPVGASNGEADLKVEPITPPPPPPPSSPRADTNSADEAMAEGIALFKKGQYSRADEIFRKLQTTKPKDARVWYFSALAHGFATGQWDGETRLYVVQGTDREREGMPPAPQIDSAFAELSPAQGKDWLASYRSQLVKR
jgi:outer membrane murein-binding lipoprotein Lpp